MLFEKHEFSRITQDKLDPKDRVATTLKSKTEPNRPSFAAVVAQVALHPDQSAEPGQAALSRR